MKLNLERDFNERITGGSSWETKKAELLYSGSRSQKVGYNRVVSLRGLMLPVTEIGMRHGELRSMV